MADREIYKEKVVIHHDGAPEAYEDAVHTQENVEEHVHADHIIHDGSEHVEHIYHTDPADKRRDWRTRRAVRGEILSFRRGIYAILNLLEIFLILRFFMEMFLVPAASPFATFINLITYPFLAPFGSLITFADYFAINWSILLAILSYGIIAYLLIALFESGIRSAYRR